MKVSSTRSNRKYVHAQSPATRHLWLLYDQFVPVNGLLYTSDGLLLIMLMVRMIALLPCFTTEKRFILHIIINSGHFETTLPLAHHERLHLFEVCFKPKLRRRILHHNRLKPYESDKVPCTGMDAKSKSCKQDKGCKTKQNKGE